MDGSTAATACRAEPLARAARALASLPPPPIAPVLDALDAVRGRVLSALGPATRVVIVPRERRIALVGCILFSFLLVMACSLPLWLIALGPLVWGVPHVVADVRYLVARPGLHRHRALFVAAAVGLGGGLLGLGVRAGLAAAAAALVASRASRARRAAGIAGCGALFALAQSSPWIADVVFVQAHNLVALGFWFGWRRRATRLHWLPLGIFAAGALFVFAGPVDRWLALTGGSEAAWTGLGLDGLGEVLSPWADPGIALRCVLFFAFAQAAHYVVWLHLVPQEDRATPTPRSFRQGYRALRRDVGSAVLWAAMACAAVVAAVALASVALARDVYLGMAFFHAHLELIAAALFWAEGSGLGQESRMTPAAASEA